MEGLGETLMSTFGITIQVYTKERVVGTMPITPKVHQPMGILHGGASVAFAETLASFGAMLHVDLETSLPVGLEINANHLRSRSEGIITGEAVPLHIGRTSQLWDIKLRDEGGALVCVSRCTIAVRPR
ncbi:MAG: PaaI family thioesterase [Candidatus Sericytochromatia bacterium]|nr:PaaI family thioesterase [Candidatus Sericytochromatia bacterium]